MVLGWGVELQNRLDLLPVRRRNVGLVMVGHHDDLLRRCPAQPKLAAPVAAGPPVTLSPSVLVLALVSGVPEHVVDGAELGASPVDAPAAVSPRQQHCEFVERLYGALAGAVFEELAEDNGDRFLYGGVGIFDP